METDKRYFVEGLFIIGFSIAAALFAVWLMNTGQRDDVVYRINFAESVSGLVVGDPVKFHGVDVGTVKAIELEPDNPRLVRVDVALRQNTPVKTDTRATLALKGITGVVYIDLTGGSPTAKPLVATTVEGSVPEIPYEKSKIATVVEQLPRVIAKLSALEDKAANVVSDVAGVTNRIKENPSLLLRPPKEKGAGTESAPAPPHASRGPK